MSDSTNKIVRAIKSLGWNVAVSGGGHLRCTHPDAAYAVFTGASPSDHRAWKGLQKELRKALNTPKRHTVNG